MTTTISDEALRDEIHRVQNQRNPNISRQTHIEIAEELQELRSKGSHQRMAERIDGLAAALEHVIEAEKNDRDDHDDETRAGLHGAAEFAKKALKEFGSK